jgi:hypothetical protein
MMRSHLANYSSRPWMFVLAASIACLLVSGIASAELTNYKTKVTFNAPIEVPGSTPQVLPAGSYVFKVVDSKVNPNVVQISNTEESRVYTTILAIPTYREKETANTVMTFEERAEGQPPALRAWFYPHEKQGQEFLYPQDRAAQSARSSGTPDSGSGSSTNPEGPAAAAVPDSDPPASNLIAQAVTPNSPAVQPQQNAASSQTPTNAEPPAQTQTAASTLPQTGSLLPLLVLCGSVCLIASWSLRKLRGR